MKGTLNKCTDSWLYCVYLHEISLFGQNMTWKPFWCHLSKSTWKVFFNQQVKNRVMMWHFCVGNIAYLCLVGLWVFWNHWSVLGRLLLRTPGPVPFGTYKCSPCWDQSFSRTCIFPDYSLWTSLGTFSILLEQTDQWYQTTKSLTRHLCAIYKPQQSPDFIKSKNLTCSNIVQSPSDLNSKQKAI